MKNENKSRLSPDDTQRQQLLEDLRTAVSHALQNEDPKLLSTLEEAEAALNAEFEREFGVVILSSVFFLCVLYLLEALSDPNGIQLDTIESVILAIGGGSISNVFYQLYKLQKFQEQIDRIYTLLQSQINGPSRRESWMHPSEADISSRKYIRFVLKQMEQERR